MSEKSAVTIDFIIKDGENGQKNWCYMRTAFVKLCHHLHPAAHQKTHHPPKTASVPLGQCPQGTEG